MLTQVHIVTLWVYFCPLQDFSELEEQWKIHAELVCRTEPEVCNVACLYSLAHWFAKLMNIPNHERQKLAYLSVNTFNSCPAGLGILPHYILQDEKSQVLSSFGNIVLVSLLYLSSKMHIH